MITTINIKVNAAHPNMPLPPSALFEGSAATFRIIDVPRPVGKQSVASVAVAVKNADGETASTAAVRTGGCWTATLPGSHFARSGSVENAITVSASGTDENGEAVENWVLGKGDLIVMDADGAIHPGEVVDEMRWWATAPETPRKGDVAPIGGIIKLYDGETWRALGGAVSIAWNDVTGKPTAFPPSAHASTHAAGGSDAITPSAIGAVAAVPGKGLSTNDYTTPEKQKLAGIEAGAEVNPTPVAPSTEIDEGAFADAKKTADFVNSSINAMAAFYITKNAAGDAFATKAELTAAIASGTFYNGGSLRMPTKNDYLYVLADESATQIIPGVNPTTRYSYDGGQWAFQITVNNTALTSAQVAAINSNITAALVAWLSAFKGSDASTTLASVLAALAGKADIDGDQNITVTRDGADVEIYDGFSKSLRYSAQFNGVGGLSPVNGVVYLEDSYGTLGVMSTVTVDMLALKTEIDEHDLSSTAHADIRAALEGKLADNTADYSASSTYAVGAFVKYNGALYVCKTAITTAEAWTPAHWTAMPNVSALFSSANTANNLGNIRVSAADATTAKQYIDGNIRYDIATSSSATMADRTINQLTMAADTPLVFPAAVSGKARDFLLNLTYTSGEMTLPQGVTKVGDELTFTAGKTYLLAFTEIAANQFYIRAIDITTTEA